MDYAFVMNHFQGKAYLDEKLPDLVLAQVKHAIDGAVILLSALEFDSSSV